MGAINFKTSDFITLAIKPYEESDLLKDPDFIEFLKETENEENAEAIASEEVQTYYEADWENAESILAKYDFYYFHVVLKPGYYESLQIDIESNFPIFYDDWTEKREALKEATEIKKFLIEAAGVGFQACSPGWCMSYKDHAETLKAIKEAAAEMRDSIKSTPTWRQYNRETA